MCLETVTSQVPGGGGKSYSSWGLLRWSVVADDFLCSPWYLLPRYSELTTSVDALFLIYFWQR
jgi:hypothetical protein